MEETLYVDRLARLGALLSVCALALACGADDSASGADGYWDFGGGEADAGTAFNDDAGMGGSPGGSDAGESGTDTGGADVFIPEEEEEPLLNPPTASRRFVFIASPSTNTVAKVDSLTFAVTPIRVGRNPSIVRTNPAGNFAAVLNRGSDSVSLIVAAPDGDDVVELDVIPGSNQLLLAPGADFGGYAVAYYDNSTATSDDPIGSLQDITVLDIAAEETYELSVGFNIREVEFNSDGTHAYVVTDSGVSVIPLTELEGNAAYAPISLGDDPLVRVIDREVEITSSGEFALVRSSSLAGLRIIDLATGEGETIELPAIPTDIELVESGGYALVAVRDAGSIIEVPLDDPQSYLTISSLEAPSGLLSLTSDRTVALTHTTVGDNRNQLGILSLETNRIREVLTLRKPIVSVVPTPDPQRVFIVHEAAEEGGTYATVAEQRIQESQALSLLDLRSGYAKLVLLPSESEGFTFSESGTSLFVMLSDEKAGTRQIEWLDLDTFTQRTIALDSYPETIGIVPETDRVFISQEADSGRLTFIDVATGNINHVSAYQLNAFIE